MSAHPTHTIAGRVPTWNTSLSMEEFMSAHRPVIDELRILISTVPKWHSSLDHVGVKRLMDLVDSSEKWVTKYASPPARATDAIRKFEDRCKAAAMNGKEYARRPNWAFAIVNEWAGGGVKLLNEWIEMQEKAEAKFK
jgi:hypothetical protein